MGTRLLQFIALSVRGGGFSHANTGIIPKSSHTHTHTHTRGLQGQAEPPFRRLSRSPRLCTFHYLIVIGLLNGHSVRHMASVLQLHRSTIYRVAARFRERRASLALFDRREDNGLRFQNWTRPVSGCLVLGRPETATLLRLAAAQPGPASCWSKRWCAQTGVRVHVGTMSRALRRLGCKAWTPATGGALPVGRSRENTASEHDSPAVGHFAGQQKSPCMATR